MPSPSPQTMVVSAYNKMRPLVYNPHHSSHAFLRMARSPLYLFYGVAFSISAMSRIHLPCMPLTNISHELRNANYHLLAMPFRVSGSYPPLPTQLRAPYLLYVLDKREHRNCKNSDCDMDSSLIASVHVSSYHHVS